MIAKTPDYIIAECGRPQWTTTTTSDSKTNKEDFSLFKSFEIISNEANKRLLPLRETLTDYYAQVVAAKLEAWNRAKSKTNKQKHTQQQQQQQQRDHDPAQLKQYKMQRNEVIKQKWQQEHQYQHQSEHPCYQKYHHHHHHHHYLQNQQGEFSINRPIILDTSKGRHMNTNSINHAIADTTKTRKITLDSDLDVF